MNLLRIAARVAQVDPDVPSEEDGSSVKVDKFGVKRYYNKSGELHREDGPAVEFPDGEEVWFQNDELHREDGPAWTKKDGSKHWYQYGRLHRDDGPAVEKVDGTKEYWLNGAMMPKSAIKKIEKMAARVAPNGSRRTLKKEERD